MREIHVDGQPFAGDSAAGIYGELLAMLDPAMAAHARIVTGFRVNGVEEPAFREPPALERVLAPDARVEVETRPVQDLSHDALADTVRLMPALCEAATQLGDQLSGATAPADAAALAELAEGLTLLVTLVQAAEAWADAGQVPRGEWLGRHVVEVARCIDALNEGQRSGDWITVADVLTYDLVPAINQWRSDLALALATFGEPVGEPVAAGGADRHAPQG